MKFARIIVFLYIFVLLPSVGLAQTENDTVPTMPTASAGDDLDQLVDKKINLSASDSKNPLDTQMTYSWSFGDGQFGEGESVNHIYQQTGDYKVSLTVNNQESTDTDELIVKIFDESAILIADGTPSADEISALKRFASRQRTYLDVVLNTSSEPDYIVETSLVERLIEKREDVKKANSIITWTSGNLGLSVLSRLGQTVEDLEELDIKNKAVVDVVDGSFAPVARFAQSTFDVLNPEYIMLTKQSALNTVVSEKNSDDILSEIRASGVSHNLITFYSERAVKDLGITNFMSYTVNFLINKGVSTDNILLMLLLPVIATLIAFARQFIGIKTFGIYTPTIITLSFLATGLKYGLTIFIVILIVATIARLILKKFRLLYLPRMAIVLTIVSFSIFAMFVVGALTGRTGFLSLSMLPILVLIILVEKFIGVQIEKGPRTAIMLSLETIVVSIACYWVASWDTLTTFLLAYPEFLLLAFVVNIILGKWVGLRISEYIRFREIRRLTSKGKK